MTHSHTKRKKEPMPEEPETQPQQPMPTINVNLHQDGMIISQVVAAIDENMMNQIVTQWLIAHPALLTDLAKQAAEAKRNELQVIRHINAKRND